MVERPFMGQIKAKRVGIGAGQNPCYRGNEGQFFMVFPCYMMRLSGLDQSLIVLRQSMVI